MKVLGTSGIEKGPASGLPGRWASRVSRPSALIGLAFASLCGGLVAWLGSPLPNEQRRARGVESTAFRFTSLSTSDLTAHDLLNRLRTPMDASRFLRRQAHRIRHTSPVLYASRFRMTFAEFQECGWRGDCNDFANAICEIGYHHGYRMGLLSMWPARAKDRLRDDWHQVAVFCIEPDREYIVFDYATPIRWHGTLEEYARSVGKAVLPIGGVLEWQPTRPNVLARFLDHLRFNRPLPANHKPFFARPMEPVT